MSAALAPAFARRSRPWRFIRLHPNLPATLGERPLDRSRDEPREKAEEGQHVRELPDPKRQAEELRLFVRRAMRWIVADVCGAVCLSQEDCRRDRPPDA